MTTKILFTDLDGTLLDDDKNVSSRDLDSIGKMIQAGHRFVIATGRPLYSAKVVAKELSLYNPGIYLVTSNGGLIYDCGSEKIVSSRCVDYDTVDKMFKAASEEGIHIHTYTDTNVVSLRETEELKIYCDKIKMPYKILERIPEDLPAPPPKFIVMSIKLGKSRQILEEFEKKYRHITGGHVESVFSNDFLLEYIPPGVSKGNALRDLCALLGIPVEDSIAAGDEANDIPMIEAAGLGCVMANGTDAAKAYADYVTTGTNNESGITEIIEKFCL